MMTGTTRLEIPVRSRNKVCETAGQIRLRITGLDEYHKELCFKNYCYLRPGIGIEPWNAKGMTVIDPFGNRIRFNEYLNT